MSVRQEQTDIDTSGYLAADVALSGTLVTNYLAADSALSGTLTSITEALSGTLVTYTDTSIANASGTAIISGYIAADLVLSGHLQNEIDNTGSNYSVASLTGLGENFSGWYTFTTHTVDGVSGVAISPLASGLTDATLKVNGFTYDLDYYIDASGNSQPGIYGTITASGGFSIDVVGPKIIWNYNSDVYSGFDLNNTDNIILRYQT